MAETIERKIPVGNDYFAREDGSIISRKHGKFRKMSISYNKQNGYYSVRIGYEINKYKTYYVHQLVMLAFAGVVPKGMEVRHFDGDRSNNRFDNLSYGTRRENHLDKKRHGTSIDGERNHMAKLTQSDVNDIRAMYVKGKRGFGYISISKKYDVQSSTIQKIINREIWND